MTVPRTLTRPASIALSWALAAGLLLGGLSVALMMFFDKLPGFAMLVASTVMFSIGTALGYVHGAVLGYFGREAGTDTRQVIRGLLLGLCYTVPAILIGWVVAGWVAALPLALQRGVVGSLISVAAWVGMAVVLYVGASTGWKTLVVAYGRWPDRALGTVLVLGVLGSLLATFYISNHATWFASFHLTGMGKLILSFVITFWIYGPLVTIGMYLLHHDLHSPIATTHRVVWNRLVMDAAYALMIGVALALLMLPFHKGTANLPAVTQTYGVGAGMVLSLTEAFSTELFLRLFLFTVVFWIAKKYFNGPVGPMWIAIGVAALADGLFHSNEYLNYGLPGIWMLASYVAVHIIIPSIAFGYLYWKRGLGTAMATHAVSGIALGLMVI